MDNYSYFIVEKTLGGAIVPKIISHSWYTKIVFANSIMMTLVMQFSFTDKVYRILYLPILSIANSYLRLSDDLLILNFCIIYCIKSNTEQ